MKNLKVYVRKELFIIQPLWLLFLALITTACTGATLDSTPTILPSQTAASQQVTGGVPTPSITETLSEGVPEQALEQTEQEIVSTNPAQTPLAQGGTLESLTVLPNSSILTWRIVTDGLQQPIGLYHAADGSKRLFVLEQAGRILIWQDGGVLSEVFLDIRDRVGSQGFEQGLLGLAFHPQFRENGSYFVNYTDRQGDTVISRFSVDLRDPNKTDQATEKILLKVSQPYANHNGGMLAFGPDGFLYIGLGDGGSAGDPQKNGQSLDSLLGKILRLDIDQGDPYAIPADNPKFQGQALAEIWAYGLRNPWRFSFDFLTGDLYIADVGQNQWEEINYLPAGYPSGVNFGWNYFEASMPFSDQVSDPASMVFPVFEYSHTQGCSVTGGSVYRGAEIPELYGVYLFGDYCSGNIWGLVRDSQNAWQAELLFENQGSITSFGVDEQGEVYMLLYSGQVYRLERK